jgi:hypothetical protein
MNFSVDGITQKSAITFSQPSVILVEGFLFGKTEGYYDESQLG